MRLRTGPVLLALAMLLGIACGSSDSEQTSTSATTVPASGSAVAAAGTPDTQPVKLTFWHSMSGNLGDATNDLVKRFNAAQSRITVEAEFQGTYDEGINKLRTSFQSKSTPHMIQVYDIGTRFMVDSKAITPVQTFITRDKFDISDYEPNVLGYYKVNDELYSMPFNTSNPILYYNKDLFKAAGLDPEKPPRTFEEVMAAARTITKKDASGNYERQGIAIPIDSWYFEQSIATQGGFFTDNSNGRDKAATKATFNDRQGEAFVQWWADMVNEGTAANLGRGSNDTKQAFNSGRVAMILDSTAALRGILSGAGDKFVVGTTFLPRPANNPNAAGTIIGGASLWIMKDHPQREQDAAWEFIKFATSPEQQAQWHIATGYYPIRKAAYDVAVAKEFRAKYPQFDTAVQQLHASPLNRATQGALFGTFVQARQEIAAAIESVLAGQATAKAALDKAAAKVSEDIATYNRSVQR